MLNWEMLDREREALGSAWKASGAVPHILVDDFLTPDVGAPLADFSAVQNKAAAPQKRTHKHVHGKGGSRLKMTPLQRQFFEEVNSPRFCQFVQDVTGIAPVIPDPALFGGGLHEIRRGGFLGVHTDFNHHPDLKKHRRFNLLVYLNETWDDAWAGHIELWDQSLTRPFLKAAPLMGRALFFETSEHSFHGHPTPLATPPGVTRKSLATYYYSDFPPGVGIRKTTNYQLTRQQWAALMVKVAELLSEGLEESSIVDALQMQHQKADVRVAVQTLLRMRSLPLETEIYWELPDGARTLEDPEA
jgi:hypothetical protein